jgi:hypothetical protein
MALLLGNGNGESKINGIEEDPWPYQEGGRKEKEKKRSRREKTGALLDGSFRLLMIAEEKK